MNRAAIPRYPSPGMETTSLSARRGLAIALALVAALVAAAPGRACSVCRCGDPLFNALGSNLFAGPNLRLALDEVEIRKDQGHSGEPDFEKLRELQSTLTLAWAPSDRLQLVARVPWSQRRVTGADGTIRGSGLSDPELSAVWRVWASKFEGSVGRRSWLSLGGGAKTDWGQNDLRRRGERLDEHAQPGTGSVDPFIGLLAVRQIDPTSSWFGSLQARRPGRNRVGYEYGDVFLANLGAEKKLNGRFDVSAELNYRSAGRDRIDGSGTLDPDTGGRILYFSPRVMVVLAPRLVGRLMVQIPAWKDLHGEQTERSIVNIGLTLTL
jgi:hypothetical protein